MISLSLLLLALSVTPVFLTVIELLEEFGQAFADDARNCQAELKLDENLLIDFRDFWDERHNITDRRVGCVVQCVLKVQWGNPDGTLLPTKLRRSRKDDDLSRSVEHIFKLCLPARSFTSEECAGMLLVTRCFRDSIFKLRWNPDYNHPVLG